MTDRDGVLAEARALDGPLVIGGHEFTSRLIVGTGKYATNQVMVDAIRASGAEMVTVAARRVDLDRSQEEGILHHLDPKEFFLLANTAGCYTAEDALRYARLARAAGFNEWVKLEVIGDQATLLPDVAATLEAARILSSEGFKVMAYTNDDLITALRLEDAGCVAVMPLASPIGSGLGVVNPYFIRIDTPRRVQGRRTDRMPSSRSCTFAQAVGWFVLLVTPAIFSNSLTIQQVSNTTNSKINP